MVNGAASINPVSKPLKGKILTFTQSDKEALLSRGYADVHTDGMEFEISNSVIIGKILTLCANELNDLVEKSEKEVLNFTV